MCVFLLAMVHRNTILMYFKPFTVNLPGCFVLQYMKPEKSCNLTEQQFSVFSFHQHNEIFPTMSDVVFTGHTAPEHTCSNTHTHTQCAEASNVILKPIRVFVWDPEELPVTLLKSYCSKMAMNPARMCSYYVNTVYSRIIFVIFPNLSK